MPLHTDDFTSGLAAFWTVAAGTPDVAAGVCTLVRGSTLGAAVEASIQDDQTPVNFVGGLASLAVVEVSGAAGFTFQVTSATGDEFARMAAGGGVTPGTVYVLAHDAADNELCNEEVAATIAGVWIIAVEAGGDIVFTADGTEIKRVAPVVPGGWADAVVYLNGAVIGVDDDGLVQVDDYSLTVTPPAFTSTVRETTCSVVALPEGGTSPDDDIEVTQVLSARCTFGFDQPVSEALVVVPTLPVGVAYGGTATIAFGVVGSGNETATRFKGTLEEKRYDLYPRAVTLVFKGPLWKAQQYQNWEDPGDNGGLTVDDLMGYKVFTANAGTDVLTATGHTFANDDPVIVKAGGSGAVLPAPLGEYVVYYARDVSGSTFKLAATLGGSAINLTTAGSGELWVERPPTDQNLVMAVLDRCGVAYDPADIGGTGQLWGATNDDQLIWRAGNLDPDRADVAAPSQSGLDWILALDAVSAAVFDAGASGGFYRTFDGPAGKPRRLLIGGRPRNAVDFTFEEGVNILAGQATRSVLEQRDGVLVQGMDDGSGGGPVQNVQPSGLTPGPTTRIYSFANPLIEFEDSADRTAQGYGADVGMDCETVALAILLEVNRETVQVTLTTPEDWLLCPGQTYLVQGPAGAADRLGTGEVLWGQGLTAEMDERGAISQQPRCLGGGIDVVADGDPNLDEVPFA